tara:strand:+ start:20344 stop:20610 length:267 start_codon:yes stop_codon:yes gene_type:complete
MPRIQRTKALKIGDILSASKVKKVLGKEHNLLKQFDKWIVEDVIKSTSTMTPAKGKKKKTQTVEITRIFLVPYDSERDHIRIRMWFMT